jgi:hypothetical protein
MHKNRYSLFVFTEGVDVDLDLLGDYQYSVFDSDENLVEVGKARVIEDSDINNYFYNFPNKNNYVNNNS